MIKKCVTAEDMRRLEAEVAYFYANGGPVMDDGIPGTTAVVGAEVSADAPQRAVTRPQSFTPAVERTA